MKIAVTIARILLGLIFVVFGLNKFLHFIPTPPMSGDIGALMDVMLRHGWLTMVAVFEVIGGLLLLIGRYVPLGLVLLGPVIVNIVFFHISFERSGLPMALVIALLEAFLIYAYRPNFAGVFAQK